jgi:hypothetical protein
MPIRACISSVLRTWPLMLLAVCLMAAWLGYAAAPPDVLMLAWDAAQSAVGYEVHYGTTSGLYAVALDTGPATTAAISGLTVGVTYFFVVLAYNDVGDSPYSNEVRCEFRRVGRIPCRRNQGQEAERP